MKRMVMVFLVIAGCDTHTTPNVDLASTCGHGAFASAGPTEPPTGGCSINPVGPVAVCRDAAGLYAMYGACHGGCLLTATTSRLECPCHGDNYDFDGNDLSSPSSTPLDHYATCLDAAGDIWVDPSTFVVASTRE